MLIPFPEDVVLGLFLEESSVWLPSLVWPDGVFPIFFIASEVESL